MGHQLVTINDGGIASTLGTVNIAAAFGLPVGNANFPASYVTFDYQKVQLVHPTRVQVVFNTSLNQQLLLGMALPRARVASVEKKWVVLVYQIPGCYCIITSNHKYCN